MTRLKTALSMWLLLVLTMITDLVRAQGNHNTLDLPQTGGGGFFSEFGTYLQQYVDFMTGPVVLTISLVIIVVSAAIMYFAPKDSASSNIGRLTLAVVILANAPSIIDLLIF